MKMKAPKPHTAKFGDFVKPTDKAELQRNHIKAEPIYIRKLVEAVDNQTTAGALIGLTGGGVSGILSSNATILATELAARYIWERDYAPKPQAIEEGVALITAEPHTLKTIKDLVAAIGGTFQYIELKK